MIRSRGGDSGSPATLSVASLLALTRVHACSPGSAPCPSFPAFRSISAYNRFWFVHLRVIVILDERMEPGSTRYLERVGFR